MYIGLSFKTDYCGSINTSTKCSICFVKTYLNKYIKTKTKKKNQTKMEMV